MEDVPIPIAAKPVKLLDRFRQFIRLDGKTYDTEKTYVRWVAQYIRYTGMRHPETTGTPEIEAFLTHLAFEKNAAPNTQKAAPQKDGRKKTLKLQLELNPFLTGV